MSSFYKFIIIACVIIGFTGSIGYMAAPRADVEEVMMGAIFLGAGTAVLYVLTHIMFWIGKVGEKTPTSTARRPRV